MPPPEPEEEPPTVYWPPDPDAVEDDPGPYMDDPASSVASPFTPVAGSPSPVASGFYQEVASSQDLPALPAPEDPPSPSPFFPEEEEELPADYWSQESPEPDYQFAGRLPADYWKCSSLGSPNVVEEEDSLGAFSERPSSTVPLDNDHSS